jgi:hypothetical protein
VSLKGGVQFAGTGCWESPRLDSGFYFFLFFKNVATSLGTGMTRGSEAMTWRWATSLGLG